MLCTYTPWFTIAKYTQLKKLLDSSKSPIIPYSIPYSIRQIEVISGEAGVMSVLFWYQICRNRLRNYRVVTMNKDRLSFKNCKCYHSTDHLLCTFECLPLQFFKPHLSLFKWLQFCNFSSNSYKFGIKIKNKSDICLLLLIWF